MESMKMTQIAINNMAHVLSSISEDKNIIDDGTASTNTASLQDILLYFFQNECRKPQH